MLAAMGLTVVARGRDLRLAVFWHGPGEPSAALDWWPRTCLVFTEYGAWTVRSRRGGGTASAAAMVTGSGGAEYDCRHPFGVDDRNLCLIFPAGVTAPSAVLVPVSGRIAALRRDLRRRLGSGSAADDQVGPHAADELDAIGWSLLAAAGSPDAPAAPGARDRRVAAELRELLDREYASQDLDVAAAWAALGLSRTRMVHVFRDVTGTTPHRYLVQRRVAHAARLLASGDAPVTEVCFASGFGSLARFQAAFKRAWGMPPSQYRATARRPPASRPPRRPFRQNGRTFRAAARRLAP
jgi:AraC-like DNA-binding protein